MLRDLKHLCDRYPETEESMFRGAARALLERQFLFLERGRDRESYRTVINHFDYYRNLFDALGWTLHQDDDFGFVALVPGETESFARLRLVDTLLVLCLRLLYEEGMDRFEVQEGSVFVDAETLLGRYEALLRRERPRITEFREILKRLVRHSVIETGEPGEDGLPRIRILPSIRLVTGVQAQKRLATYLPEEEEAADDEVEEVEEEEEEERE